ncbi:hypothetical protein I4U23_023172 [Adineta vaga]|nr:hypothetical protein I4U23_023172 [Adineta vaga]
MSLHLMIEWSKRHRVVVISSIGLILYLIYRYQEHIYSISSQFNQQIKPANLTVGRISEVLLIYVYANAHSYAYGNLKYFIENAVQENDGVDYYFILQQIDKKPINESIMPVLPKSNAFYIQHENKCFDYGTIGWFFDTYTIGNPWKQSSSTTITNPINLKKYKYFIFMNSSIRGPFFPPYFIQLVLKANFNYYWYSVFTKRINDKVKLVGCTISCEAVPHVQSYFLATDFSGLSLFFKPGNSGGTSNDGIFHCYPTKDHVSINSEIPMSNRIIESGYMIDCLLTKYQTIDFTKPNNRFCNANLNPYKDRGLQNTSLEPYEVVFVKSNDLVFLKDGRDRAILYQKWMNDVKSLNRTSL